MRWIAGANIVCIVLLCPCVASAQDERVLELLVIEAVTPAEHENAARFYAEKAKDARAEAARHTEMGGRYVEGAGDDPALRREWRQHCDRIAALHREMAEEYEALAKSHAAEARELRAESTTPPD